MIEYLVGTSSYDEKISYYDRAFAYNSLPYLAVFLLFGALVVKGFAETIVMDVLGLRLFIRSCQLLPKELSSLQLLR